MKPLQNWLFRINTGDIVPTWEGATSVKTERIMVLGELVLEPNVMIIRGMQEDLRNIYTGFGRVCLFFGSEGDCP